VSERPAATAPRPYRFPDFERRELENGMAVWLVPLPDRELVSVHLVADAGAASEEEPRAGIAALTAQLLVTGTSQLDAAAFAEATERLGIEVSSESSWDSARAGFTALGDKLDAGLELLAEMIRSPRLDEREFDRLKAERLNDILQARADPGRLADERFLSEVFADGVPYGRLSAGTPDSVEALTVADARTHLASTLAPDVTSIVVAGAFDTSAAMDAVEARFGDWTGHGRGHRSIRAVERGVRRIVLVDRPGSVQSELRVGHLGIDRAHPRYFDALVTAALLGGVFGSRLNRRLREELGYTYSARCAFDPRRSSGPFTATVAVQTEVTVDAIRELLGQLERIRNETPAPAEVAEVRDFLVGVFPLRFETTAGIAAAIEPLAIYGLPQDYWHTYRGRIEAVDEKAVRAAAVELVRPDEALIVLTGDASVIRDELEGSGIAPVEVTAAGQPDG
jgi:zinc protease